MQKLLQKKFGFTLAEVLITLGVIGVVAALTIPTLMANIQGKRFASQFRKTISTLSNAVRMNQANHDFNFADAAGRDDPIPYKQLKSLTPENSKTFHAIFNGNLKGTWYPEHTCEEIHRTEEDECYPGATIPHTLIIESANNNFKYDEHFYVDTWDTEYLLNDGSMVVLNTRANAGNCSMPQGMSLRDALLGDYDDSCDLGKPCLAACGAYIDVNGPSGPNREVKCKDGQTTSVDLDEPCEVNAASMGDVFPIVYFDSTVAPATNASKYVFEHYK